MLPNQAALPAGRLSLLQVLLLLRVSLLHLLSLLLVLLLDLLLSSFAGVLLLQLLMFLLLPLLQLMVLLVLFVDEFLLLLLILLITRRVAGIRWLWDIVWLHFASVSGRTWDVVFRSSPVRLRTCTILTRASCLDWRVIFSASCFSRDDASSAKLGRSRRGCDCRSALIDRSTQLRIGTRHVHMLHLVRRRGKMTFMLGRHFLGIGMDLDSAFASVKADVVVDVVVDNCGVVSVVNVGDVDVHNGAIIEEVAAIPSSALKADPEEAEAVIDASVEADVRAPVAFMEDESRAAPAPISWRP